MIRRLLTLAAAGALCSPLTGARAITLYGDYGAHDPSRITRCGDKYYLYCTGPDCPMKSSSDMIHWKEGPGALPGVPAWAHRLVPKAGDTSDWIWAPDVLKVGNSYFLFYSFSTFGSRASVIGLVTSPTLDPGSPDYHWTDRGLVVASSDSSDYNAIDPCPAFDDRGALWLTFGSWNSGGIQLVKLDGSTGKPTTLPISVAAHQATGPEASFLWYHKPYFYLFENEGTCCQGIRSTYRIMLGRSKQVSGPYLDRDGRDLADGGGSVFLAARGTEIGPGQLGIFRDGKAEWYSFHYYDATQNGAPMTGLEKLTWDRQGWPNSGWSPPKADVANGQYGIISSATGRAFTIASDQAGDGTQVILTPYGHDPSQQWQVKENADGWFSITSVVTGKAIDLWACGSAPGTKIDEYRWLDNPCQRWQFQHAGSGWKIVSQGGGGVITEATDASGKPVIQEDPAHEANDQSWLLKP